MSPQPSQAHIVPSLQIGVSVFGGTFIDAQVHYYLLVPPNTPLTIHLVVHGS
jgi:hypothetical protein